MNLKEHVVEVLTEIFSDKEIVVSDEDIKSIASDVLVCVESFNEIASYRHSSSSIHDSEIKALKKELEKEQSAKFCHACNGHGFITENFMDRSSTSQCTKCWGKGKIYVQD